ncbi:hypothetical protein FGO68_gene2797 [Halteria grandinella]|uniref:Uncharacterized protein n=1 Tax=Halteria grandinella TaxID=5974 RepID=A0A8J8NS18_HALGN|nr:hypothetical protein FGO68_gene2797 [Halteria grandinella]
MNQRSDEPQRNNNQIQLLEVDVNIGNDLTQENAHSWKLITQIENCTLRDHETYFSFSMIYTFLHYADAGSSSLPPIQLEISKFCDDHPQLNISEMSTEDALEAFATLRGLIIYGFEQVVSKSGEKMVVLKIKLKEGGKRQLILKFMHGIKLI